MALTRSSQYGMVIEMPFDFVAEVRCFLGRLSARSNANFKTRSTPTRVVPCLCNNPPSPRPGKHPAADGRVLPFRIFPHDVEVDITGFPIRQRRRNAWHQADRTKIDVLIELAPELKEGAHN